MEITAPSVAIVILNWNGKHHLQKFLPSVLATSYPGVQIIVADNASNDDSVSFLNNQYPDVRVIHLEKNYGFAAGYNKALSGIEAQYFVLLNSDVEVQKDWLQPIIALLEKSATYAACQPKILSYASPTLFEYAGAGGGWIDKLGYPFARGRVFDICEEDLKQYDSIEEVFWASGAAMVIKSSAYRELNGFDEYFFAHQEEIDLCWRLKLKGYKVFCCPQSVIYHLGGGTLPRGNSRKTLLNFRNNQIMLAKNLTWNEKLYKIPIRLFLDQLSAVKGLVTGDGGYFLAIFKAHIAFLYWIVFGNKRWTVTKKQKLKKLKGVYNGNIVWQHFVKKKKTFADIIKTEDSF